MVAVDWAAVQRRPPSLRLLDVLFRAPAGWSDWAAALWHGGVHRLDRAIALLLMNLLPVLSAFLVLLLYRRCSLVRTVFCMELASASLHRYCAVNLLTAPLPPCSRILGHSELGKHKGVQLLVPVAEGAAGGTGMRVGAAPTQHKVVACGKGMARRWGARCNQQRSRIGACNEPKSTSMASGLEVAQQFTGTGACQSAAPRAVQSRERTGLTIEEVSCVLRVERVRAPTWEG